jgi:ribose transport system permease protein
VVGGVNVRSLSAWRPWCWSAGANRLPARKTKRLLFCTYMWSAAIAGLGGLVLLARSQVGDPTAGPDYTLGAIAAVFLGATTIAPGRFNVIGTIVGVFFVAVAVNGLTLLGAADWVEPVFDGAAVIAAVSLALALRQRREASR